MKIFIPKKQSTKILEWLFGFQSMHPWFLLAFFILFSCSKYELPKPVTKLSDNRETNYFVRLTDAPGDYDQVNVDIQSVVIKSNRGEISLNVNKGVYNLLDFRNGIDTLIATAGLDSCIVSQIRFTLGNKNSIMIDSVLFPLEIASGSESGLKLQVHHEMKAGISYKVLIDFDADKSILKTGNGNYKLKPVLRCIDTAISGSIQGIIQPAGITTVISCTLNGVTYTSIADINGRFLLKGLEPGTYSMQITPTLPYVQQIINGIEVKAGITTNTGIHSL